MAEAKNYKLINSPNMNKIEIKIPVNDSELLTSQNKYFHLMLFENARMKKNQFLIIVLLSIGCAFNSFAQNDLKFEINKVLPFISIQEAKLDKINTLTDLDKLYPASWVREYISVEISAYKNGIQTKASGISDVLNQEQKELIRLADLSSDIAVIVTYIPNNSLKNNPAKQYDFKVTIMPDKNAIYSEGVEQLNQYLQENSIANIKAGSFTGYDLTAIKFTITEQGDISDIKVAMPSKDTKIDKMLVEAISKMPSWKPAAFSNGLKVKQDFVLTIGNMENCMVNLLNIRPK
jgi:hypothetical protein